jgi:hypothetical protein
MAESAEFILKLNDQVSGPSKAAAEGIKKLDTATQRAVQTMGKAQIAANAMNAALDGSKASGAAKALEDQARAAGKADAALQAMGKTRAAANAINARIDDKAATAARKMAVTQSTATAMNAKLDAASAKSKQADSDKSAKAVAKHALETRKLGLMQLQAQSMDKARDAKKNGGFLSSFTGKLPFRSISDYASGAFFGEMAANAATGIIGAFASGASAAVGLITSGIKMAFVEGGKAENLRLSYKHLLGASGGKEALDSIGGFADRTKFDDDKIAEMMQPLFRAGLKGTGARTAFALAGDAGVRGQDPSEVIAGLAKIQLKGGITDKLLTGALGVSIKDFKDALGIEMKTADKEGAYKKATEGKLDPMAIQNAIVRATEKQYGTKTGTATNDQADTMSTHIEKLSDLPSQYLKKMSESPAWAVLSAKLGDTLKGLSPDGERGKKIIDSLFHVFDKLATAASTMLTSDNIDKFAAGVVGLVDSLGKVPDILGSIYRISRDVAMIWGGVALLKGVQGFSVALNAAAGTSIALMAPLAATAAALGAVAYAYTQIADTAKELGGWDAIKDDIANFNPGEMVAEDAANQVFDDKYSGAGYKLKTPGSGVAPSITHNGDVNLIAAPGQDAKATGESFAAASAEWQQKLLEKAAAQGGG